MIFENLKNFEWYNEPANVTFGSHELEITAAEGTDFWQSKHHNFFKDDGHFFFIRQSTDFNCVVKWRFENAVHFNQCGLMLRADEHNWFKISVMSADEHNPEIGSCVTKDGISDWAGAPLPENCNELWYKSVRHGDDYVVFYSVDGVNFIRVRQFALNLIDSDIKIGAYICAPRDFGFKAVLDEIDFFD